MSDPQTTDPRRRMMLWRGEALNSGKIRMRWVFPSLREVLNWKRRGVGVRR